MRPWEGVHSWATTRTGADLENVREEERLRKRERARQQVFDVEAAEYVIKSVGFGAGMIWAEVITTYTLSDNCQITLIFDV